MNQLSKFAIVCMIVVFVGCNSGGLEDDPVSVEPTGPPPVKAMLENVAQTGDLGSASMEIREALEKMKADGNANADALLTDLSEMEAMADPEAVKQKAQEMIDSLE